MSRELLFSGHSVLSTLLVIYDTKMLLLLLLMMMMMMTMMEEPLDGDTVPILAHFANCILMT